MCLTEERAGNGMPVGIPMESEITMKNPMKRVARLTLLLLLVPAAGLFGQAPDYRPPPPPTKGMVVEMRLRYLLKPSVQFTGFGNLPFLDSYESVNNITLGSERVVFYNDGALTQDYIRTTLVEGGDPFQDRILSPTTEGTAAFTYANDDQVSADDPSTLIFHRYASQANSDVVLEGSTSGSMGWELNYTQFINRKRNLGVQVGFSFNGFDSLYNDEIAADLYVQEFKHKMVGGADVPDKSETSTEVNTRGQDEPTDLLEWLAYAESESLLTVEAKVNARG